MRSAILVSSVPLVNKPTVTLSSGVAGFGDYVTASTVETVFALHQDITDDVDAVETALHALANPPSTR